MAPRVAFALVALGVASACSLADFTEYTDGDAIGDGGSSDAPATSTDGPPAMDDSSTNPPNDGGSDAPADALPDVTRKFCETNADGGFFCEDFEGPNPLLHFDLTETTGGTLVVDNGTMIADAPASSAQSEVLGTMSANGVGSNARLAFSVEPLIVNTTTSNSAQVAKIYFFGAAGSPPYEVGVGIHGSGSSALYVYEFTENGAYKEFGNLSPLATGKMTRIVLEARIDTTTALGARVNLFRDGVLVVNGGVLSPPRNSGDIEGYIGLPFVPAAHGAWKVRMDDLLMGRMP